MSSGGLLGPVGASAVGNARRNRSLPGSCVTRSTSRAGECALSGLPVRQRSGRSDGGAEISCLGVAFLGSKVAGTAAGIGNRIRRPGIGNRIRRPGIRHGLRAARLRSGAWALVCPTRLICLDAPPRPRACSTTPPRPERQRCAAEQARRGRPGIGRLIIALGIPSRRCSKRALERMRTPARVSGTVDSVGKRYGRETNNRGGRPRDRR